MTTNEQTDNNSQAGEVRSSEGLGLDPERAAVEICGHQSAIPVDADLIGCGKPIATPAEVYRCTDCGIPFHRECAKRHFATDTPENAQKVYAEQLRRLDATLATGGTKREA